MSNFWDFSVWGWLNVISVLMLSLFAANILKRSIKVLKKSLIPASVLGGAILIVVAIIYKLITKEVMFDTAFFGGNGTDTLEILTYHALALGFIASTFKSSKAKLTKKRSIEIFNTGVTTVATYLLQAVLGLGITLISAIIIKDMFPAAGVLLPFGYGQGTGQALNYGTIYETDFGFDGGKTFGLTIAALGFLSACIGGVIHLAILKRREKVTTKNDDESILLSEIQSKDEIPLHGSMDKFTTQIALIISAYFLTYMLMMLLGHLLPGMKSVIYGFNFLLGVISATLINAFLGFLYKKNIIKKKVSNDFLMTRASNFFFDLMVVAGVAAIRLDKLEKYWGIIIILGVVGLVSTYFYNLYIAKKLFPEYENEQFLTMYGMLTGTASTGIILLREIDGEFKTPASDNMVYQNFPAIVFGFPLMLLATLAPKKPILTLIILVLFFIVMNIVLFRSFIFKKKK